MAQTGTRMTASSRLLGLGERMAASTGTVTLGEIVDALGPAAMGTVLLVLTLPALLPIPGPVGLVFGTILAFISAQLMFGARRLWLPDVIRRRALPAVTVAKLVELGAPFLRRAETRLKPRRLLPLTGRIGRMALALPLVLMAIAIALPIPLGNVPPALSVIALALGLTMRDGVAVLIGLMLAVCAAIWMAVLILVGSQVVDRLAALVGW